MSAPSIPNLLSLRARGGSSSSSNRGSRGGRAGDRGAGPRSAAAGTRAGQSSDSAVQGTDTDAAVSRLSAVDVGYLNDPYARYFVSSVDGPPARRFPIINRGTYTRTSALDILIASFLSNEGDGAGGAPPQKQIISLGAGTDTRPFRLFSQQSCQNLIYHEIDFAVISSKKLLTVKGAPSLSAILRNPAAGEQGHWSSRPPNRGEYHCHGLDIRDLASSANSSGISLPGFRTDVATLVLSECCLCYLTPEESEQILHFFTSHIPNVATILYEPIHLGDAFGDTMVSNLAARNIYMPGLAKYRNQADQEARLMRVGFERVRHKTVDAIWEAWIATEEKERVNGLEGLDEIEEWKLLAGHYLVVWGVKGVGFESWKNI